MGGRSGPADRRDSPTMRAAAFFFSAFYLAMLASAQRDDLLATAVATGRWLNSTGLCSSPEGAPAERTCSWRMNSTDAAPANHPYLNTSLYYGPPGVAIFLAQLEAATGDADGGWRSLRRAALRSIIAGVPQALTTRDYSGGKNVGFYYGLAGLAYGLRAGSEGAGLDSETAAAAATIEDHIMTRVRPFAGADAAALLGWWNNTDVAHGVSGTGLYLLWAYRHLSSRREQTTGVAAAEDEQEEAPPERLLQAAIRGARWLLSRAEKCAAGSGGLRWARGPDTDGDHAGQYFPTFCCGTAGVGYFLAELALTLPNDFTIAAADDADGDPNTKLTSDRLGQQGKDSLREALINAAVQAGEHVLSVADPKAPPHGEGLLVEHGEQGVDQHIYYLGWCGGGAGWSRLFVKLYQATGDRRWLARVDAAAAAIQAAALPTDTMYQPTPPGAAPWRNLGQCCGAASVGSFMLRLAASPLPFPRNASGPASDAAAAAAAAAAYFANAVHAAAVPVSPPSRGPAGSAGATGDDYWHSEVAFPSPEEHLAPLVMTTQAGWMQGAAGMASFLLDYRASIGGNGTHNGTHPRGPGARVSWPDEPW